MTEAEAHAWLATRNVPRETLQQIAEFLDLLKAEAGVQNLVAASTLDTLWSRHVVDSAQLLDHVAPWRNWLDLGSGAGFPGMIIAIISGKPVTMIESRAKRIAFLQAVARQLHLEQVTIVANRVETAARQSYDVISARAFAPLPKLLDLAFPFSSSSTRWMLPKGRSACEELAAARASWHGEFALIPSITDAESAIIAARNVRPRKPGR